MVLEAIEEEFVYGQHKLARPAGPLLRHEAASGKRGLAFAPEARGP